MNSKFTNRAREAIEKAMEIAQLNMNTVIEVEHLLKAILETKSILNSLCDANEVNELKSKLNNIIGSFGKQSSIPQPQLSYTMSYLLTEVGKKAIDFVSIPLILLHLLNIDRIAKLFKDKESIKKD